MEKIIFLNLEQMKLLSDKNKINILKCFENEKPLTIKEIAESLELVYANINYHVKVLEKAGIIEIVDTKIKSGILEKYYLPSAEEFRIDKFITMFDEDNKKHLLKSEYDSLYKEFVMDYQYQVEMMESDNKQDAIFQNSIIFLREIDLRMIKKDIADFIVSIEKEYSVKTTEAHVYSIGNLLIPTKDIYEKKNSVANRKIVEEAT